MDCIFHEIYEVNDVKDKLLKQAHRFWIKREWQLWLLVLPAVIYYLIFHYAPMYGITIAFKRYSLGKDIMQSPWVGLLYFKRFFASAQCWELIRNTLFLSFYQLAVSFPLPVILALVLNHTRHERFKKAVQTITYAPHFISLVVLTGILSLFGSPTTGIFNLFLKKLGIAPIYFMAEPEWFPHVFVFSHIWQHTGYQAIIFLAALTSVDVQQYEAATLDGASKFQKILYIDLPAIVPTLITVLLLQVGRMLNVDTQKVLLMQSATNLDTSEIIGTYVYKIGLLNGQFSYSTAINLFQSVINVVILLFVNQVSRALTNESLW